MAIKKRILVVGTSGSGKTTLASALARRLHIPHYEMDAFYWQANWIERPTAEFLNLVSQAASGDQWVMDGNYSVVQEILFKKATTVIWLNYSFPLIYFRVLKRTCKRVITKSELFSGNVESFRRAFLSSESMLWWVIKSYPKHKARYKNLFKNRSYKNLDYIELTKSYQAKLLIQ